MPDLFAWAEKFENRCHPVARTVLENGLVVSTIFLPLNAPMFFETIIFLGNSVLKGPWRYPDWAAAARHHLELAEKFRGRAPGD